MFVDGHITLLRPDSRRASGRFLAYALGLPASRAYIEQALSAGATKQQELNLGALRNHKIAVANLEAQHSIADFLDRECARISELGAELAALEATTQDWRTLIFSRATSEFPRVRLRFAIASIEQGWSPPCEERQASDEEWGVLKLGCVNHGSFTDDHKVLPSGVPPRPELEVRSGDVLMSRANTRELVGSCAVVNDVRPQLMLSDLLYRLRIAPTWDPEYVVLGIGSHETRQEIRASAAGSSGSMPKLNHGSIKGLTIPASDLSGQRTVVREVLARSRAPRAVLRALPEMRAALAEYRDALITEAVTGKLDVAKVSESQMAESLDAVREGERPEVLSS